MSERKSPTAVLHEGPRALSEQQVRQIEGADLAEVLDVDIDDVIEYVHKDMRSLPDYTTLYRKYLGTELGAANHLQFPAKRELKFRSKAAPMEF